VYQALGRRETKLKLGVPKERNGHVLGRRETKLKLGVPKERNGHVLGRRETKLKLGVPKEREKEGGIHTFFLITWKHIKGGSNEKSVPLL
jgi:hypothetical protein